MLYIVHVIPGSPHPSKTVEWHTGEKLPDIDWKNVRELQADGDELAYIENLMGSKMFNKPSNTFVGWLAQQIFVNL